MPYTLLRPCDQPTGRVYADCRRLLLPPQAGLPAEVASEAGVAPSERAKGGAASRVMIGAAAQLAAVESRMARLHEQCAARWVRESQVERAAFAGCCIVGKRRRAACGARPAHEEHQATSVASRSRRPTHRG